MVPDFKIVEGKKSKLANYDNYKFFTNKKRQSAYIYDVSTNVVLQ